MESPCRKMERASPYCLALQSVPPFPTCRAVGAPLTMFISHTGPCSNPLPRISEGDGGSHETTHALGDGVGNAGRMWRSSRMRTEDRRWYLHRERCRERRRSGLIWGRAPTIPLARG